jgi:RNA polymerase primary sigma factor
MLSEHDEESCFGEVVEYELDGTPCREEQVGPTEARKKEAPASGPATDEALHAYISEISKIPLLTKEEEIELGRRVQKGDEAAAERMIRSNLRLVVAMAHRCSNNGMPLIDLIQEGNQGLMRAVRKFDPEKGFRFSTYATWWIRQAMNRGITNQSRTIRLPAYMAERVGRFEKNRLSGEATAPNPPPTPRLLAALASTRAPLSIDRTIGEGESSRTLGETLWNTDVQDPVDQAARSTLGSELDRVISGLPERERLVLKLRFGLTAQGALTLEDVGSRIGVTRERVRQIERQALNRLKAACQKLGMADYLRD